MTLTPQTRTLLSKLCKVESKTTLVRLWADLNNHTKNEFERELLKLSKKKGGKKTAQKKGKRAPDLNTPEGRIAEILRQADYSSEKSAAAKLIEHLDRENVDTAKLPRKGRRKLENWLKDLFEEIPDSVVLEAAKQV